MKKRDWKNLAQEELKGKVFVIPTDTIYGFSCLHNDFKAKEKIIEIKKRDEGKYFIHLISLVDNIKQFNVEITERQRKFLEKNWPGRLTVIFRNLNNEKVSFRIPDKKELRDFIKRVGPVISTSANISGEKNIEKISDLSEGMKNKIDFYIDEGELKNPESMILEVVR